MVRKHTFNNESKVFFVHSNSKKLKFHIFSEIALKGPWAA